MFRLATPVMLLAFGSLCTLLGFLGCCGAIRENYCLTVSFAVLLALVIVSSINLVRLQQHKFLLLMIAVMKFIKKFQMLETAAVITAYALHEDLRSGLSIQLQMGLSRYNRSSGVQMAWDQTQQTLSCCGVANSSDWSSLGAIPDSCCIETSSGCARELAPLHPGGCMEKVENWILINAALVGGASAVLAGLQVVGVCFACCLSKSILKDFHDFYY
ncbi:tetraspanin family protein [Necator americanus]|uniref:Tetraspanin n=1 Tax=Necator americanus TaxID=51031 RepID=W2T9W5_NECAM|nr:tetraspanin family protein [Necator americanus]ETN78805.1 tetraspanin family protein [Necator americanus]